MAGSFNHLLNGMDMIENMGDAAEAFEQLMWVIQRTLGTEKTVELLNSEFYPMVRGDLKQDDAYRFTMQLLYPDREG